MKIKQGRNKWQKWEITIEVSNYEPRSPGTFGGQLVLTIEKPIVLARTESEAVRKALRQVTGFKLRVIDFKKKKCD